MDSIYVWTSTAAAIAAGHTLLGPDHYLPFVLLAKAQRWSLRRTVAWTVLGAVAHIASSLVIAGAGALLGWQLGLVSKMGEIASAVSAWGLVVLGVGYAAYGLWAQRHHHHHAVQAGTAGAVVLLFLLGPCEPLIALLWAPAVSGAVEATLWVAVVFSLVTVVLMVALVVAAVRGADLFLPSALHRFVPVLSGVLLALCGGMLAAVA